MKTIRKIILAFCVSIMIASLTQATTILYDNGSSGSGQDNTRSNASQRLYDNFLLGDKVIVTDIYWQQFDRISQSYGGTSISIFSGTPEAGPIFSGSFTANRSINGEGTIFNNWQGYDYSVSGLNIMLDPGTYWIGINNTDNFDSSWANTTSTFGALQGSLVFNKNFPTGNALHHDKAFTLEGNLVSQVPDAGSTVSLAGIGILFLIALRKRLNK